MYQPPIVSFPVFSVTWAEAANGDGSVRPAVLAAGGGGAGKTGVGNRISLVGISGGARRPGHTIISEVETSPDTSNCISAGRKGQLIAAAFGPAVRIYVNNPSGLHDLVEFKADESATESGINSIAFVDDGNNGGDASDARRARHVLATGGEDGVMRVWEMSATSEQDMPQGDDHKGNTTASLNVSLISECKGHSGPITCVRFHPFELVVLTSSKDGTCRLWDWQSGREVAMLATASGVPDSAKAPKIMCRSCCFSPNRKNILYTVQSGSRGKAYVTEWRYKFGRKDVAQENSGEIVCTVEPVRVSCVSPYPATTVSVRSDGRRLAVGNVEGTVLVYRLPDFAKVKEYPAHDLPVTGLGFAPGYLSSSLGGYDLLAGSADYKITLFTSEGNAMALVLRRILAFVWYMIVLVVRLILWTLRTVIRTISALLPLIGLATLAIAVYMFYTGQVAIKNFGSEGIELEGNNALVT